MVKNILAVIGGVVVLFVAACFAMALFAVTIGLMIGIASGLFMR